MLLLVACHVQRAGGQQPPGSPQVVPPLTSFMDPHDDAHDTVGRLIGRGETLAQGPGAVTGPTPGDNDSVALLTTILKDGTFEVFMAEGHVTAKNRTVQRYTSKDLQTYAKTANAALPPQAFLSATMARDNATGRYMLLVYKPRFVLKQNFSTCTKIQRPNQSSVGDLRCGGHMWGCDRTCSRGHFECRRPNATNDTTLEVPRCFCGGCNVTQQLPCANQSAAHVYVSSDGKGSFSPATGPSDTPISTRAYPSGGLIHHPKLGWLNFQVIAQVSYLFSAELIVCSFVPE
eukprot:COSAG01_NODE_629_length_14689_cov_298.955517_13_plen_289_part_00